MSIELPLKVSIESGKIVESDVKPEKKTKKKNKQKKTTEKQTAGPSCSKLMTWLVNDSLTFRLSDIQIC